jgi:hypothetical protein
MFKNALTKANYSKLFRNRNFIVIKETTSNLLNKFPKRCLSSATGTAETANSKENVNVNEIRINKKDLKYFYPIRGIPQFTNGLCSVFEYSAEVSKQDESGEYQRLPQVPYEIKEHALKGFYYTFFLVWVGRVLSNFSLPYSVVLTHYYPLIPLGVFSYQYLSSLWYMSNAVTAIKLKEDGLKVVFEFKNFRQNIEVEIWRIQKDKTENFFNECYAEPFLYPITLDYSDIYGEYSLRNKKRVYLYGDSFKCIKDGEIFRAILNGENIQLK